MWPSLCGLNKTKQPDKQNAPHKKGRKKSERCMEDIKDAHSTRKCTMGKAPDNQGLMVTSGPWFLGHTWATPFLLGANKKQNPKRKKQNPILMDNSLLSERPMLQRAIEYGWMGHRPLPIALNDQVRADGGMLADRARRNIRRGGQRTTAFAGQPQ